MTAEPPHGGGPVAAARRARARLLESEARGLAAADAGLSLVPGHGALRETVHRDGMLAGGLLAGGIAFRLFLWLLPAALLVASVLGLQRVARGVEPGQVVAEVDLQATFTSTVAAAASQSGRSSLALAAIGLWLSVYTAMSLVRALRISHALAWGLPLGRRPGIVRDGAITCGGLLAILGVTAALRELRDVSAGLWLIATLASLLVYGGAWLGLSLLLPRAPGTGPRDLLPGAVLVAAGAQGIHLVVALYLADKLERSAHLYGVFGAAATVLFWLYLIGRLMVLSGFLNGTLHARRQREGDRTGGAGYPPAAVDG